MHVENQNLIRASEAPLIFHDHENIIYAGGAIHWPSGIDNCIRY